MSGRRYAVISPCRDEQDYIEAIVASIAAQEERPQTWVIVDDGSTDRTPQLLAAAAAEHDWITIVTNPPRTQRILGSGVVHAFNKGLAALDLDQLDFISKLDIDVTLTPRYYSLLMDKMAADPRLGSASGNVVTLDDVTGEPVTERGSFEISAGPAKFYRVSAFRDMGGLIPQLMWDGIDCHELRSRGWHAYSFADPELLVSSHRLIGSSDKSIYRGRRRHGYGQWYMGTDPAFMLASAALRAKDHPAVLGSANMVLGYVGAACRRVARHGDARFRREVRRFQRESMVFGKEKAVARWESRREGAWSGLAAQPRMAYLVSQYPALSHAFIETEVKAMTNLGWKIEPFSVRPSAASTSARPAQTTVLTRPSASEAAAALRLGAAHPRSVLAGVRSVWTTGRTKKALAYVGEAALLLAQLDRKGLNHLHVHFANNAAEIARLAVLMDRERGTDSRGLSYSLTVHGLWMHGKGHPGQPFPTRNEHRWGPLVDKLDGADAVVHIDAAAGPDLAGLGVPADKLNLVRMGVDCDVFTPVPRRGADTDFHVVYVGRLAREKSLATLLLAMASATTTRRRLSIVGDGPERPFLEDLCRHIGIEHLVTFRGPIPHHRLPQIYADADVVAMTSVSEGIPTVLMEAMACGRPVVATPVGGIPELVTDGRNGFLVGVQDHATLAQRLDQLAADPALAARMGAEGRARVLERHDVLASARELTRVFAQAGHVVPAVVDPAKAATLDVRARTATSAPVQLPPQPRQAGERVPSAPEQSTGGLSHRSVNRA